MIACGVDEAGRGPLAGPLVAAAVIIDDSRPILGVRDSKKLSEKKRNRLFDEITSYAVDYKISIIDTEEIDRINILQATMKCMHECLKKIAVENHKIFIDGNYFRLKEGAEKNYDYETIVKGDSKIYQVSCASILAKVTRDRIMVELDAVYPDYNFKKNKGYATNEHISILRKHGMSPVHRNTFCDHLFNLNLWES